MMKRKLLGLLILIASTTTLFAQKGGVISGIIREKTDRMTLPGATILLDKFNRYTISDKNGYYELLNVPVGKYTIEVRYLGYKSIKNSVTVSEGVNSVINWELEEDALSIAGVVVMGEQLRGQAKALNTQKTNTNVSTVISADQVGRFPDSNIGDALKRVSGVTMQNDQGEARNIVIRGVASELNSVTFNGNRLPSAEGDNRKVQMDLIPAEMIHSIEVNKTLTPDMDADAIGGSVDLITRAVNRRQLSATVLGGYNPIRQGGTHGFSFVFGDRFADKKLGMVLSASYNNKDYGSDNIEAVWAKDDKGHEYVEEMDIRKYDVQRVRRSISLNTDYKINSNNTLYANAIYNWRDDRENRFRKQLKDLEPIYTGSEVTGYKGTIRRQTKGGIDNQRNQNRRLEDQRIMSYTLGGTHLISARFDMDWSAAYSKASEDRPNERYIMYQQKVSDAKQDLSDTRLPYISSASESLSKFGFKELSENHDYTSEDEWSFKVNARTPLSVIEDQKGRLRFGLRARLKSKQRDNIFYEYSPTNAFETLDKMPQSAFNDPMCMGDNYTPGIFVSNKYLGGLNLTDKNLFDGELVPGEYVSDNFNAKENIYATYLRWDQNITENLLIITGARFEHTSIEYTGNNVMDEDFDNIKKITNSNKYYNILPSVTMKYDFSDRGVLRAAFTTALARPNYYDLVPFSSISSDKGEIQAGNSDLKATYSFNFDLMGEYYFQSVGVVTGGVFYKRLNNFIYTYADLDYRKADFANDFPTLSNPIPDAERWSFTQPLNGKNVDLYGFEVSLQRKLDFMPTQFFRNFNVYLNYTYTNSKTSGIFNEDGEERTDVKLPGTAPHMFNASLAWENKRFTARVSLNYTGSYIDEVTDTPFSDRYYDSQLFVDANASYKITKSLRIFAEANNLTNQPLRYYQGTKNKMMQLEYYKPSFQMGLKFDL